MSAQEKGAAIAVAAPGNALVHFRPDSTNPVVSRQSLLNCQSSDLTIRYQTMRGNG